MPDTTTRFSNPLWPPGKPSPWLLVNETLERICSQTQTSIEDRHLTDPPASPTEGSIYLVAGSAINAWTGQDGKLAHYSNGGWIFHTPVEGWVIWVKDENRALVYDGAAWIALSSGAYTMPFWQAGVPGSSAVPSVHIVTDAGTLPAGLTGSRAKAGVAATSETVVSVQKNEVQIGTITFAAASGTGTFAAASPTSLAPGDLVRIVFPASADATLANIAVTLRTLLSTV